LLGASTLSLRADNFFFRADDFSLRVDSLLKRAVGLSFRADCFLKKVDSLLFRVDGLSLRAAGVNIISDQLISRQQVNYDQAVCQINFLDKIRDYTCSNAIKLRDYHFSSITRLKPGAVTRWLNLE